MREEKDMHSKYIVVLFVALVVGTTSSTTLATTVAKNVVPGANGRIVFVNGTENGNLTLVNANGAGLVTLTRSGSDSEPAFSPGGTQIAFSSYRRGDRDIYRLAPDGSNLRQLTFSRGEDRDPTWSASVVASVVDDVAPTASATNSTTTYFERMSFSSLMTIVSCWRAVVQRACGTPRSAVRSHRAGGQPPRLRLRAHGQAAPPRRRP